MKDIFRIADMIKEKINRSYAEDVAIFAYYGSYATGNANENSDLDFFFIPKTERGKSLMFQFIIDEVGFDLFPISWERAEKIVALEQPLGAVISESKVLYYNSEEDLNRFNDLKVKLADLCSIKEKELLLKKGYEHFNETYIFLYNMQNGSRGLSDIHIESSKLITNILQAIAYVNLTFYKGGMGKSIEDALKFSKLPEDFKRLIDNIIMENEVNSIIEACATLINNTRKLMQDEVDSLAEKEPYITLFEGYYEELKSSINKVVHACEAEDYYTAFFRSSYIQEEVSQFIAKAEVGVWYNEYNYYGEFKEAFLKLLNIDLMAYFNKSSLVTLKDAVMELDKRFEQLLIDHQLKIAKFESIDEFGKYFRER